MEKKFLKKLGERIKKIRKEKNISQEYISLQTGISMNTISCIELGKTSAKIDTINKIAKIIKTLSVLKNSINCSITIILSKSYFIKFEILSK